MGVGAAHTLDRAHSGTGAAGHQRAVRLQYCATPICARRLVARAAPSGRFWSLLEEQLLQRLLERDRCVPRRDSAAASATLHGASTTL